MLINSKVIKVKVTAIKFIKSYLYVATSGNLIVYDVKNLEYERNSIPLVNENVLQFINIYGIIPDEYEKRICIFGGRCIRVLPPYPNDWPDELPWKSNDWIWCARWLKDSSLVIVTGHNELSVLKWPERVVVKTITCEEKCILYSALIVGDNYDNNLVVMSGTVYQEILIWVPSHFGKKHEVEERTIIHRLKGHNGVIFSINYDMASQRICSTSDDRTVRVWSVVVDKTNEDQENMKYLTLDEWRLANIQPLYCVFGHAARVFNSCMVSDKRIISISEDSYICVWDESGNNILKQETHQGGKVCCLDYSEDLQSAASGGADGGVSIWPIPKTKYFKDDGNYHPVVTVMTPNVPARIKVDCRGNFVVSGRNSDSVFIFQNNLNKWSRIFQDDRILNYCLLALSPCHSLIAIAMITGHIIVLRYSDQTRTGSTNDQLLLNNVLVERQVSTNRILSIIWLSDHLILCCDEKGAIYISKLSYTDEKAEHQTAELNIFSSFMLPPSKERWITSAVLFAKNILVCGDRCGSIHVYNLDHLTKKEPLQTFYKTHGRLGVTCLTVIGSAIWSCGRDGYLRQYSLTIEERKCAEERKIEQVFANKINLPWAAKIIHSDRLGILLLGFHDVDFMVWSVKCRVVLWKYDCGGGHREWDCIVNNSGLSFHFLKDKLVNSVSVEFKDIAHPPITDGFHIREVNALSLLTRLKMDNSKDDFGHAFIISGSEDASVRVSIVSESGWQSLHILNGHLSSVRAIAALPIGTENMTNKFLLFSAGGRAQLKIWLLEISYVGEAFSVVSKELLSYMLRGVEKVKRPWKNALPVVDPETRYMDLSAEFSLENKNLVTLCAACSDGYLRIFNYKIMTNELEQLYLFEYQRCMLQSLILNLKCELICDQRQLMHGATCTRYDSQAFLFVTTSTDGKVTFWAPTDEKSLFSLKVHQSGVNACCFTDVNFANRGCICECVILLATGGDDGSVTVNVVIGNGCEGRRKFKTVYSWTERLHSSQVSGIKIVDDYIITAGGDQRVNVLKWTLLDDAFIVNLIGQQIIVVADVHGIEIWKHSKDTIAVCTFGVGMEVLHIKVL